MGKRFGMDVPSGVSVVGFGRIAEAKRERDRLLAAGYRVSGNRGRHLQWLKPGLVVFFQHGIGGRPPMWWVGWIPRNSS